MQFLGPTPEGLNENTLGQVQEPGFPPTPHTLTWL